MSKALKHYIVYSGSSGWWHSENLSVQEWVNKIDHNMNSLCQLGRGAHIRYSANLVVCAKVGGSGAMIFNDFTRILCNNFPHWK